MRVCLSGADAATRSDTSTNIVPCSQIRLHQLRVRCIGYQKSRWWTCNPPIRIVQRKKLGNVFRPPVPPRSHLRHLLRPDLDLRWKSLLLQALSLLAAPIFHFNHFSISVVSSSPTTCLNIAPITFLIVPLQLLFSTTPLLITSLDEIPFPSKQTPSGPRSYNLRPRRHVSHNTLGLGISLASAGHKPIRGRPSKLAKQIKISRDDVAQGHQNTIY